MVYNNFVTPWTMQTKMSTPITFWCISLNVSRKAISATKNVHPCLATKDPLTKMPLVYNSYWKPWSIPKQTINKSPPKLLETN